MRYCLEEVCYCLQLCASSYPCGSNLFNDSSSVSWHQIIKLHCILSSITKTLGKISVLKVAIEEQDFSSILEQEEQHGCEIDECSFFRFGLVQKIDKIGVVMGPSNVELRRFFQENQGAEVPNFVTISPFYHQNSCY